jgi:DnaJ-class molecular chaperone
MDDPYQVLGVAKDASEATIRAAYRKLAKRHHPDLNPGKPDAAERFKAIAAAHELLSDPEKRARFDRGEIDASGQEKPPERPFYRDFADAAGRGRYQSETEIDPEELEAMLGQMFGDRRGGRFSARGRDVYYQLAVDFIDAANGAHRRVGIAGGHVLDVTIPPGARDGDAVRIKGQGMPGIGDGPPGDAVVEFNVNPHPLFRREQNDIIVELPVTLREAVLGAAVEVPTIRGPVKLRIPAQSGSGTRLRLRERGINGGHQYVVLKILVPPGEEPELEKFLEGWAPKHRFDPRAGLGD